MNLPIFALFIRSLRHDARHAVTYVMRLAMAVVILVALFSAHAAAGSVGAPGLEFFRSVVYINLAFITLAGMSYFASAITEEKEEMTLGLLRMTALNPVAILLGKSTSRLLTAVMMLAVQVPFTMLSITLGGVAMKQVVAAYMTLTGYTLFLSNLALLFSVLCRRTAWAATMTALVLLVLATVWHAGLPAAGFVSALNWPPFGRAWWTAGYTAIYNITPPVRIEVILGTGFAGPVVGEDVLAFLAAGAVCFLFAWLCFNWTTREQREVAPGRGLVLRRSRWWLGLSAGRAWRRPLVWKDYNFIMGGRAMWWLRWIGLCAVLVTAVTMQQLAGATTGGFWDFGLSLIAIVLALAYLEMMIQAARIFRSETQWKTLSSLMILPMSPGVVVREKIMGCALGMTPYLLMLGVSIAVLAGGLPEYVKLDLGRQLTWQPLIISGLTLLGVTLGIAQCVFFLYLVVYLSLVMKRGALAMALAVWAVSSCVFHCSMVVTPFLIPVIHYQVKARLMALATEEIG